MEQVKQTAIDWLVEKLTETPYIDDFWGQVKKAKEMEKKQIINAYLKSKRKRTDLLGALKIMDEAEQYYNETFKSE
jgi:hypothetical protein